MAQLPNVLDKAVHQSLLHFLHRLSTQRLLAEGRAGRPEIDGSFQKGKGRERR
jgi:hypothetical protein